ncbi:MAG: hypothetical protein NTY38_33600, partial [Acidobacteria bacterium]|nr:hypothetical protein [Acidobacteriota bacterium]
TATVSPFTRPGREIWREAPVVRQNGAEYQLENVAGSRRARRKVDPSGNTTEYGYGPGGELSKVNITAPDGSRLALETNAEGSACTATTARGNSIRYSYSSDGRLRSVEADGRPVATYEFDAKNNALRAHVEGSEVSVTHDQAGRLSTYGVKSEADPAGLPASEENVRFSYSNDGRLAELSGDHTPAVRFTYSGDGGNLATMSSDAGTIHFSYNAERQLTSLALPDGSTAEFTYGKGGLRKSMFRRGDLVAGQEFDRNGPILERDFAGRVTRRRYDARGIPASE